MTEHFQGIKFMGSSGKIQAGKEHLKETTAWKDFKKKLGPKKLGKKNLSPKNFGPKY